MSSFLASEPTKGFDLSVIVTFLIYFVAGIVLARILSFLLGRTLQSHIHPPKMILIKRLFFYLLLFLVLAHSLEKAGIGSATLLGAAGIFTVALGFASQTSASNFISGLFLMGERPFQEGDTIQIEDILGEVISIDLLSVKLRTFDNLYVRIPNETMIKSKTTNYTKFPIRRLDLSFTVGYGTDLERVEELLRDMASAHPHGMEEPQPIFRVTGLADSGINIQFLVWSEREHLFNLRTELWEEILICFSEHGIEIPYPHRSLIFKQGTPNGEPVAMGMGDSSAD